MAISDELRKQVDLNNECCCGHCLSNKCKEWAFSKGYSISIHQSEISGYIAEVHCGWSVTDFHSRFEPEAIIKCCEWVLKEINEKQLQH